MNGCRSIWATLRCRWPCFIPRIARVCPCYWLSYSPRWRRSLQGTYLTAIGESVIYCSVRRILCHLQHGVGIDRLPRMSSISTKCACQARSWQLPLSFLLERYMNSSVPEKRFQWDPCYFRQAFSVYSEQNDQHVPEGPCT